MSALMSENEGKEGGSQQVDLTILELEQLLGLFVGVLATKAWQYMGLRMAPGKEEIEKDLAKAAAAIDCASVMVDKMAPYLPEREVSSLRAMVADLQINYAKQS